jgi:group I intron endonuclease
MVVYKVTSPSGKCYIGITVQDFNVRKLEHYNVAKGKRRDGPFQRAILKYGDQLFWEVIDNSATSLEELKKLEIKYIHIFDSYNNGYNCTLGGEGNWGWKPSKEVREKISKSNKGQKRSDEAKAKMSLAKLGKPGAKRKIYATKKAFKLINKNTNEVLGIFTNISECARSLNIHSACINRCLKYPEKYKYYKQYKLEYC